MDERDRIRTAFNCWREVQRWVTEFEQQCQALGLNTAPIVDWRSLKNDPLMLAILNELGERQGSARLGENTTLDEGSKLG